jgi:hypothetical protein
MAAPDLATLFQLEEQLNEAFTGVLNGAAPSFYAHSTEERPADHINVVTELGAATGQLYSNREWCVWSFRLRVTVVTERDRSEPTPIRHGATKAKVRSLLSRLSAKFSTANLPYLQIALLRPENTQVSFDNDQQRAQDVTTLEYAGQVAILNTAWPTVTANSITPTYSPAPDLVALFSQEEQLNAAVVGVLDSACPSFYAHDTRERPKDHISVVCELGAANGQVFTNQEWCSWDFRLQVTLRTERDRSEPSPARHAAIKGEIRSRLSRLTGNFTTANLPYLQITLLRPENTAVSFENDQNKAEDVTVMDYAGQVAILNTAWPTVAAPVGLETFAGDMMVSFAGDELVTF